jgi:type II secretion system protein H
MQILEIGNKLKPIKDSQSGFSLLEILVVLVIISITLGMASLALPNNDERKWRDMNQRLIVSLNQANEEVILSGAPINFQIDTNGWRFSALDNKDKAYFLSEPLNPYKFEKNIQVEGTTEFTINELGPLSPIRFVLSQDLFKVAIVRRTDGYFEGE